MSKVMKKVQNKISSSSFQIFNTNNISIINKLMNKNSISDIPELKKIEKKSEQIILLNYLIYSNIKNDISAIMIFLFNKIYNKIKISKTMKEINFKDLKHLNKNIKSLSKIKFNDLQSINFQNCAIEDEVINTIQNIFTSKLIYLNLSENKLTNLQIFSKDNIFNNLNELNLSHNNIEEINLLMSGKFVNLKKLHLSYNKISNIKCLDNSLYFNNLEELDLSDNNIRELNRINIPSLKFIVMTNNLISEGIINFLDLSYGANELILKYNNNELNCNYSKFDLNNTMPIVCIKFKYVIEKNDINDILEKIKFIGINKLILEGFENLDFLVNDTLNNLTELDLRNNSINNISILNNVKFNKLRKLLVKEKFDFLQGFNSLKKFNDIHFKIIYINRKDDKYKCRVIYNTDCEINFTFDDLEFLKDELLIKSEKIELEQSIWDDNIDFFFVAIQDINSYPLFKIKPNILIINFKNNKYEVSLEEKEFYSHLNMHFILNNLNIFKLEFFNEVKEIHFSGLKFDDNIDLTITAMTNLEKIYLFDNYIELAKILLIINEMKDHIIINSNLSNKCNNNLLEFLDEQVSMENIDISGEKDNDCIIKYRLPFYFYTCVNKKRLNKIKTFKFCETITLDKIELTDDDITFLKHDTLLDLKKLTLDENKITNIEFLDKMKSNKLKFVSLKKNLISNGLKYIEDNIKSEKLCDIEIKRKSDNQNIFLLSLNYNGNYQLNYDMLYDINKSLEILKEINLDNISSLDLSNLNLKNIDFLLNNSLSNIEKLNLDNNEIEDISVFSNVYFTKIRDLSIKKNPIKKGVHVLKSDFFKQSKYIELSVSKEESEYKLNIEFKNPKFTIEFYISDIEDIKNIFDFETCVIHLNKSDNQDIKYLENNESVNESSELYDRIKSLIDKLQPHDNINHFEDYTSPNYNFSNDNSSNTDNELKLKDSLNHIIIDNGSCYFKAGFSREEGPRAVFRSCVGYPKYESGMKRGDEKKFYIGSEAKQKRSLLKFSYPIENGIVNNWDDMEKIWEYIFTNELSVDPKERNIMLTEPLMNPKENKEKMAQIMFETFKIPGLYIANQTALSLYAFGKFTGIVIDSGEDLTQIAPIFDGFLLPHAIKRLDISGRDLTKYFMKLLLEIGIRLTTTYEKEIVKAIKKKSCYVALDFEEELKNVETFDYELIDGTHIFIKDQRIRCPEALFKPYLVNKDCFGIGQACYDSIQKCDIDIKKDFYNCIALSGGTTMFNGLPERLTKEIKALAPESIKEEINVINSPERKFAVWIGGSILSTISSFESQWITKNEYEEYGATIVHRKCF